MALELNIKPEDVEQLVKDSIMKAGFGKAVSDAVTKAISGYNNPVEDAIKRYVGQVADELIREKYSEEVRTAVQLHMEACITAELINKVTGEVVQRMQQAVERY